MLQNYLKITLRNIKRNKVYTLINVFRLAIGLACSILIILWIQDELSYDSYHDKSNRIYRVVDEYQSDGAIQRSVKTSAQLAPAMVQDFPEVENAVRFSRNKYLIAYGRKQFWHNVFFADPSLFDIFTIPLIKGDPQKALNDASGILISEQMAKKYFADELLIKMPDFIEENSGCRAICRFDHLHYRDCSYIQSDEIYSEQKFRVEQRAGPGLAYSKSDRCPKI